MTFLLSSQNVFEYLAGHNLCEPEEKSLGKLEIKAAKNFNLLISLRNGHQLLIKQERHNSNNKTAGEFANEWRIQEFLKCFSELNHVRFWLSEVLHFNANDSIIVFNYLSNYYDLADFYARRMSYPTEIAASIGAILATIHCATFNRQDYWDFFSENPQDVRTTHSPKFVRGLDRISPEVFGSVPADGIKFFVLYQRYDSLGRAISELTNTFNACCLVHNDLKLNNILIHLDWEQALVKAEPSNQSPVRLIDWERSAWGDPAFDLGTLIASYLQLWLGSLVVSKTISIEESLRMAITPMEQLQPSIAALVEAYLKQFPEVLAHCPDFLLRVVQFAGLALIQQIQATIQYQKVFGNAGICTLQVAKSLLCRPAQCISTVFGWSESELATRSSVTF